MLYEGTRYAGVAVYSVRTADRGSVTTLKRRQWDPVAPPTSPTRRLTVADSLHALAVSTYADPRLWTALADVNTDILFPLDIVPGESITLPEKAVLASRRRTRLR